MVIHPPMLWWNFLFYVIDISIVPIYSVATINNKLKNWLFWSFTVRTNCYSDLENFANSRSSGLNLQKKKKKKINRTFFSQSRTEHFFFQIRSEQFFLIVGQNNFRNKMKRMNTFLTGGSDNLSSQLNEWLS
jgi:hypothetical protein